MKHTRRFRVQVLRGRLWVTVFSTECPNIADDERIRWVDNGFRARVVDSGVQLVAF